MRGVFLVSAQLANFGFIVSPTSRSAKGADILVTDAKCSRAFSVQVKTSTRATSFWLVGKHARDIVSRSHVYVLVWIRSKKGGETVEYYVVPSVVLAKGVRTYRRPRSTFYAIDRRDLARYKDKWSIFGNSGATT